MDYVTTISVYVNGFWKDLDLFPDTSQSIISLNFALADITDINTRSSSFSKSITLPDTKNNREAFEYISELTSDSLFNPNLKTRCKILIGGITVFSGDLQLKQIDIDYSTGDCRYEVVVYNDNDTFIRRVGEKFLSDLDISQLDHDWNYTNIVNSWYQNSNFGYYYPLLDYQQNWWDETIYVHYTGASPSVFVPGPGVTDFYPSVYVRYLLDAIIRDAGYTWKSNFLSSDMFNKLVIPFNNSETLVQGDEIYNNLFRVEFSPTASYWTMSSVTSGTRYQIKYENILEDNNNNYQANPTFSYIQPIQKFATGFNTEFIGQVQVANNITRVGTSGFFTYSYPGSALYDGSLYVNFRRDFATAANGWVPVNGGTFSPSDYTYLGVKVLEWGNTPDSTTFSFTYPQVVYQYPGSTVEVFFNNTGTICGLSYSIPISSDILDGHIEDGENILKYSLPLTGEKFDMLWAYKYNVGSVVPLYPTTGGRIWINSESSFSNVITSQLVPSGKFNMNSWLPRKFKQKDFLKGLITMFNLIIDIDKTDNKTLIIEPWNDYYDSGTEVDWTGKVDLTSIQTNFVSDFQSKKTILTYKNDSDYLNSQYQKTTEEIYGQEIYEFDNDYIIDEKKVESSFSSTPIISLNNSSNTETNFPIGRFTQTVTGGKFGANLRILFKNFISLQSPTRPWWSLRRTIEEGGYPSAWYEIPYAGHLDNPYNPQYDLNFGQVYTSSFSFTPTRNTLYNLYWKDYLDIINNPNTRILTANFYLTPVDISNFKFSNIVLITLNGSVSRFIVNKITDYNPAVIGLTKVELIKL